MADIVGASLSNISRARETYRTLARGSSAVASNLKLPDALKGSTGSKTRIVLNIKDARTLMSVSTLSATTIVSALKQLAQTAELANHNSLVSSSTNLNVGGDTRVSRLNISAGINRTLDSIDSLVEKAGLNGANLLASDSGDFYLQTTDYGGKIAVTPLPLDRKGLNLEDLTLVFEKDVLDGLTRLKNAYVTANDRLVSITQLRDILVGGNPGDRSFQQAVSRAANSALPAGSFVDLKG